MKQLRLLLAAMLCVVVGGVGYAQTAVDTYLDPMNYATIDDAGFNSDVVDNLYYFDEGTSTLVVSVYGAYQSRTSQLWTTCDGSGSSSRTWVAPSDSPFKGSSYYHTSTTAKTASANTSRVYIFKVTNVVSVSALVKSGGTSRSAVLTVLDGETVVGTESDNTNNVAVLTIDELDASKIYTVKLTGSDTSNSDIYEVAFEASSDKAEVEMSFPESSYEVDINDSFVAPTLSMSPSGLAVTYSSSDENVATVDAESGRVSIVGVGTTEITAEFAGNDSYKAESASYVLKVVSSVLIPVTSFMWNVSEIWGAKTSYAVDGGSVIVDNLEINPTSKNIDIDSNNKSIDGYSFGWRMKFGGAGSASGQNVHFKIAGSCKITVYGMSGSAGNERAVGLTIGSEEVASYTNDGNVIGKLEYIYSGAAADVYVYSKNSGWNVYAIKVEPVSTVDVTLNGYGYASLYYSNTALMVPAGVQAITYTADVAESTVYDSGTTIPADEAVVLKGTARTTYSFVVSETTEEPDANNALRGSDEESETTGDGLFYMLSAKSGKVGFYWGAAEGAAFTSAAHKAYLVVSASAGAKDFYAFDEATGIANELKADAEQVAGTVYNLNGQRVSRGCRGVVIVNGKKMMNK